MSELVKGAIREAFEAWHAKENMHLYGYGIDPETGWYRQGKVQEDWRLWESCRYLMQTKLEVHAKEVVFEWKQTGTNCDEPILKCKTFGHEGEVYLSYDNKRWTMKVDSGGERGFETMAEAKARAEEIIRHNVKHRIDRAADLVNINVVPAESTALIQKYEAALHKVNECRGSTTNFGVARAIACEALGIKHTDSAEPASLA